MPVNLRSMPDTAAKTTLERRNEHFVSCNGFTFSSITYVILP